MFAAEYKFLSLLGSTILLVLQPSQMPNCFSIFYESGLLLWGSRRSLLPWTEEEKKILPLRILLARWHLPSGTKWDENPLSDPACTAKDCNSIQHLQIEKSFKRMYNQSLCFLSRMWLLLIKVELETVLCLSLFFKKGNCSFICANEHSSYLTEDVMWQDKP